MKYKDIIQAYRDNLNEAIGVQTVSNCDFSDAISTWDNNYDLTGFSSIDIYHKLKAIGMYKNAKLILTEDQITGEIFRLANARGIEIVVDETTKLTPYRWNVTHFYTNEVKTENLPDSVFFNDKKKATTLMFDKKATVVKASSDDEYSRRIGFLEAYFQATCGLSKNKALKYLKNIVEKEDKK